MDKEIENAFSLVRHSVKTINGVRLIEYDSSFIYRIYLYALANKSVAKACKISEIIYTIS